MEIGKDMTLDYDCKMLSPYRGSHLKDAYHNMIGRLNSKDRAIYDHFYDSLSLDFEKRNLSGRALRSLVPALHARLCESGQNPR